jgi:hypothetical protein
MAAGADANRRKPLSPIAFLIMAEASTLPLVWDEAPPRAAER